MALDEALMGSAAATGHVTLRLYRWDPPCLSFGRNQVAAGHYDPAAAAVRGIEIVRRPTGGRAVFHSRELTYSVTLPDRLWGGPRASYRRINRALADALDELGLPVSAALDESSGSRLAPTEAACFRDPAPGEVVALGRKLVGSAQWRHAGALLQHGSILLVNEQCVVAELRTGKGIAADAAAAIAIADLTGDEPAPEAVAAAIARGFQREIGDPVRPDGLEPAERLDAERLTGKYRDDGWTWRR